jgi:hypothetical protein
VAVVVATEAFLLLVALVLEVVVTLHLLQLQALLQAVLRLFLLVLAEQRELQLHQAVKLGLMLYLQLRPQQLLKVH